MEDNIKEKHTKEKKENSKFLKVILIIMYCVIIIIMILVFVFGIYKKKNNQLVQYENNAEIEEYNNTFSKYSGQYVEGARVKQLINDVITNNNKYVNEKNKFVSIRVSDIRYYDYDSLKDACTVARLNNTKENIDLANQRMNELIQIVDDAKTYSVFIEKTNNRITDIEISAIQN